MELSEIIAQKISMDGPISFCDYMEMCLYYPKLGYYSSAENKTGLKGDYYTTPYLTSLFGKMIGRQLEEMWQIMKKKKFTIVEYGAGTGILCYDILDYLKGNEELYEQVNYCIIEKSPEMRKTEQARLHEKVSWHDDIEDIPLVNGCILSNELVDNFSVHQVVMEDELFEVFVDYNNGFVELLYPASQEIKEYLSEQKIKLKKGFRTEINLQAIEWIKGIAKNLETGFVLTIDYGFPSFDLYSNNRSLGTLLCYHKHEINHCPYINIGAQDITAHVNFSALHYWGLKNGLNYTGFTNQGQFLIALGLLDNLRKMEETMPDDFITDKKNIFLINALIRDMGRKLKVLIQHKGLHRPVLSGLMFPLQLM
ncbi:MAG TPA: SAM-dependent methyltransferase [Flavisolibacter sp.]|nr:SAM-dependent methyltransferase [Flavisolibacter sp.]